MRGFDKHLHELLEVHPDAALEHAKLFAELPLLTQLAIMRRRRKLSQRVFAKKAVRSHILLVPDEELARIATT